MVRHTLPFAALFILATAPAVANPLQDPAASAPPAQSGEAQVRYAAAPRREMGGGFIEFLFTGNGVPPRQQRAVPQYIDPRLPSYEPDLAPRGSVHGYPQGAPVAAPARPAVDPRFERQVVAYEGKHAPGTLVIDTPNKFLYLVQGDGRAMRYGIGVGRPGFTWAGVKSITRKAEWPDWTPPPEMLKRRPDLPRHMAGGPDNPLGARAMYLGSSLYRIHGSNEPWTIGTAVSSGCIRMRNEDVIDLYGRVKVGTKVIVI
jgi:lipoprotein-anchoring transpeptidase ErfK/SrfK